MQNEPFPPCVPLPAEKKSVLEEKPISLNAFHLRCALLLPRVTLHTAFGRGAGQHPAGQHPQGEGRGAEDLEARLRLLSTLRSPSGFLSQQSLQISANKKSGNTHFSAL